jgi:hypothetical protein
MSTFWATARRVGVALALAACGGSPAGSADAAAPDAGAADAAAPDAQAPVWLDDPSRPFPATLSEVGIYPAAPDLGTADHRSLAFEPVWELWTNGSHKRRLIVLPPEGMVDNTDRAAWRFPAGTVLFKTFSYRDESDAEIPIETRLLRRGDGADDRDWDYAVYQWNADATDAVLLPGNVPVEVAVDDGGAEPLVHAIPSLLECRICHESNPVTVIGFDELRLGSPLPGAGATQLEELHALGALAAPPPAEPDRVVADDDLTRTIVGYLHGNCAHCHNGGAGPDSAFDMRHPVALANTIGQPTEGSGSASGIRIAPGDPDGSVLFLALSGESDEEEVRAMPPLGVQRRDQATIEIFRTWITDLPDDDPP